jgi:hypothetical protein
MRGSGYAHPVSLASKCLAKKTVTHHVPSLPPLSMSRLAGADRSWIEDAIRCFPEALTPIQSWMKSHRCPDGPHSASAAAGYRSPRGTAANPYPRFSLQRQFHVPLEPGRILSPRICTRAINGPHRSCAAASQTRPEGNGRHRGDSGSHSLTGASGQHLTS